METNDIKKALECCASEQYICTQCPIDEKIKDDCECGKVVARNALALITSQEQRIGELTEEKEKLGLLIDELEKEKRELWEERNRIYNDLQDWKAIAEQYQKQFEDCAEDRAKLTEENERLHASCTELTQCCTKLETLYKIECKRVDTVRADTVREMQERFIAELRKDGRMNYYIRKVLDQIVKEILEGTNET